MPAARSLTFEEQAVCRAFGERVRDLRRSRHLSQQDLARLAVRAADTPHPDSGLDRAFVNRIERGLANPSLVTLVRIARGLDIPLHDLLAGVSGEGAER